MECWKHNSNNKCFGWNVQKEAEDIGLTRIDVSPTVEISVIPLWLFPMPIVDLQILEEINNKKGYVSKNEIAQIYIDQNYSQEIKIFTDGSKDPVSGNTAVSIYIPHVKIRIAKRTSNHLSVYSAEMIAILMVLNWVEEIQPVTCVCLLSFLFALIWFCSGSH